MKPPQQLRRVTTVDGLLDTKDETPEQAFRRLYKQKDRLYRALALVTGRPALAAEAVDEAMIRAYERWEAISEYESPEAWVYRVALNWSRSMFRKRNREDLWRAVPEPGVNDRYRDHEVRDAIASLPVRYRAVVVARYLLDWSTAQTAEGLGVPENTVKTRLRRALQLLSAELGGES